MAAAELIYARGVAATSLDQVLERSGAGESQLYHYFPARALEDPAAVQRALEAVLAELAAARGR
jgi:TetR/AcrR family transcriptional regulator, transcriptional repressor for nem operon